MHFYESMIMWTKDGLQLKSYANQHPEGFVIAKPKYIPTTKIRSEKLQLRELDGKEVNRLDYWIDEAELKRYVQEFEKAYPDYIYRCNFYNTWFFGVPTKKISHLPDPRKGARNLMKKKTSELDKYLFLTREFISFLLDSGIKEKDIGLTNSTLLGNYTYGRSDIDVIIFGKDNSWKVNNFLKNGAKHPLLKWRDLDEWKKYYSSYNAGLNFTEEEFIKHAIRKFNDGFFDGTVFSIFGVEESDEPAFEWGKERYESLGIATIKGKVVDNYNGIVRPGYYALENTKVIDGPKVNGKIKQVVTFARDFMLQAWPGENIAAKGVLEKATPSNGKGEPYYRVTVGYFDSYISRKGEEFIKAQKP